MEPELDQIFAALADPTRRDLVARLAASDATVGELAEPYAMSVQAVSQRRTVHLEAGVFDLMTKWIERYRREAEARYQRLDAVLADLDRAATEPTAHAATTPSTTTDDPKEQAS